MNNPKYNKIIMLILGYILLWAVIPSLFLQGMFTDSADNISWTTIPLVDLLGTFKHPALGAWVLKFALKITPTSLSAILLLSASCILITYFYIYKLGREFLPKEKVLFAILFTSTLYYLNVRSLQYNQNIIMLPFWSAAVFYTYKSINTNLRKYWVYLGIVCGLGMLAKYEIAVIILVLAIYLIFNYKKSYNANPLIAAAIGLFIFSPNLVWLIQHDFLPINYMGMRADIDAPDGNNWLMHLINSLNYFKDQIGLLIYPIILAALFGKLGKFKINKDNKFSLMAGFAPFILVFLISFLFGIKIPAEWSYPFYLFTTLAFIQVCNIEVTPKRLNIVIGFVIFVHVCIFSVYFITMFCSHKISSINIPAEAIGKQTAKYWHEKVPNKKLEFVIGDNAALNGYIPAFTNDKPEPLFEYSFIDSPHLSKQEIEQNGAIGILEGCPTEIPNAIKDAFPNNKISNIQCYSADTVNTIHPQPYKYSAYVIYPSS